MNADAEPLADDNDNRSNWMMEASNLFGQVGMIVCWYWDGSDGESDGEIAVHGVSLIPQLLSGDTEEFTESDWWLFLDALGTYTERDETLEELYQIASQGYHGKLPPGPTKRFDAEED